jgi:hypothetical protein
MKWGEFRRAIVENLSDDLLSKKYLEIKFLRNLPKTFGHCYVASEAAYYLLGGKESGWKPVYIKHLGCPHWYLQHECGAILDLTKDQFQTPVEYEKGRGTGFLTKEPSKRARKLLKRIAESKVWRDFKLNYKNEGEVAATLTDYLKDLCSRGGGPYKMSAADLTRRTEDEAE